MKKEIQTPVYKKLHNQYVEYLSAKGYKANKNKVFERPIKEFLLWLEDRGITIIKEVTTADMMQYYHYLTERPKELGEGTLSDSSIITHLLSISFFVEHLLESEQLVKAFHIPKHGKRDQKPRAYLTIEEIKVLYKSADNQLEQAILSVAYGCGLRRTEMERLNTNDVLLTSGMLIVRNGKGDKRREVPMSDTVLEVVKKYIMEYRYQNLIGKTSQSAFFIGKRGGRMKGDKINDALKEIIKRTENQAIIGKEISLHSLRHSIANHLMENNASLEFIKDFLGHTVINTSYVYAIKNKQRTAALKQYQHLIKTPYD